MPDVTSSFGVALRQLRDEQGWSQEQLAARAELNRTYIGDLERGHSIPSLATLEKLARALSIHPSTLLHQTEQVAHARHLRNLQLMAIAC